MIIDITHTVTAKFQVWDGDVGYEHKKNKDLLRGDHSTCSSIKTSVHLGSHADAPCHFLHKGSCIADTPITPYLGPCQVIKPKLSGNMEITLSSFNPDSITEKRVLFKTGTFNSYEDWNKDFAFISSELVLWLSQKNIILVGIDTPSVDSYSSGDLPTHKQLGVKKIAILEGLKLDHVNEGLYELIALPLKLKGLDASPVRAILRDLDRKKNEVLF